MHRRDCVSCVMGRPRRWPWPSPNSFPVFVDTGLIRGGWMCQALSRSSPLPLWQFIFAEDPQAFCFLTGRTPTASGFFSRAVCATWLDEWSEHWCLQQKEIKGKTACPEVIAIAWSSESQICFITSVASGYQVWLLCLESRGPEGELPAERSGGEMREEDGMTPAGGVNGERWGNFCLLQLKPGSSGCSLNPHLHWDEGDV